MLSVKSTNQSLFKSIIQLFDHSDDSVDCGDSDNYSDADSNNYDSDNL